MEYNKTQGAIARGLTKPLGPIGFKEFVKYLGLMTGGGGGKKSRVKIEAVRG